MKVNGMLDIASKQTTSKPSKGNSKSTDTLFQDILGQKSSQGSEKTTSGSKVQKKTDAAQGSAKNNSDSRATETKDPEAAAETQDAAQTEAPEAEAVDETQVSEETEEIVEEEPEQAPDAEETADVPQQIIPVYVPPQSIETNNAAMETAAPPVIQTAVQEPTTEIPQQVLAEPEMTVPQETASLKEAPQGAQTSAVLEEPVLEIDPQLLPEEMAEKIPVAVEQEQVQQETTPVHEVVRTTEAEDFAAQVVREAHDLVTEPEAPVAEANVDEVTAAAQSAQAETEEEAEQGAPQEDTTQTPVTAQVGSDGRVQLHTSAAQPLEAEPYIEPEIRQQIVTQVVDSVHTEVTQGRTEFYVQLKPDFLGGLSIGLVAEDKGIVAKLMTSSHQVHSALQADMTQIVQMLRDKGINVVQMEVIYDQTANSTMKDNSDNRQQNFGQDQRRNGRTQGRVGEVDEAFSMYDTISTYEALAEQGGSVEYSA